MHYGSLAGLSVAALSAGRDPREVGAKAAQLARVAEAGFRIPVSFVVPAETFRQIYGGPDFLARWREVAAEVAAATNPGDAAAAADRLAAEAEELLVGLGAEPVAEAIVSAIAPPAIAGATLPATHDSTPTAIDFAPPATALPAAAPPVAAPPAADWNLLVVRSSADLEDTSEASFAGQLVSTVGVPRTVKALTAAVQAGWTAPFRAPFLSYCAARAIDPTVVRLALLIQPLVPRSGRGL